LHLGERECGDLGAALEHQDDHDVGHVDAANEECDRPEGEEEEPAVRLGSVASARPYPSSSTRADDKIAATCSASVRTPWS
jgi:hypothetical protein